MVNRVEMEFREPIQPHENNGVALQYPDGTRDSDGDNGERPPGAGPL